MKRFVSALIAGAMILGMSVSAFASDTVIFGKGEADKNRDFDLTTINFSHVKIYHEDGSVDAYDHTESADIEVVAGDVLYFAMNGKDGVTNIMGPADEDWRIRVRNPKYVESADFYVAKDTKVAATVDSLWVKVVVSNDFNSYEKDNLDMWFYVEDSENKANKTGTVKVMLKFADYDEVTLYSNEVKSIVPLKLNTLYTLADDVKSAKVVFSYDDMYFTVPMYADDKFVVNEISTEYNKKMSIALDTDVEVVNIVTNADVYNLMFESSKDNKVVYEVNQGVLVNANAEYVEKFEPVKDEFILADGYILNNVSDSEWVILDNGIEVPIKEETKEEVKPSIPSTDKVNPETGAGDFVGMASTMAVMTAVAGAALLIAKK